MKQITAILALGLVLGWTNLGFSKFESVSDIEGTWMGQEDRYSCVFPVLAKFVSLGNVTTGIVRSVGGWGEGCVPIDYYDDVLPEGFLRADISTIIFPLDGGIIEYTLSEDGETLTGKTFFSGKLYSTHVFERE